MAGKTKTCKVCGEAKTLDHFTKVSKNADGLDNWCRECSKARKAEILAAKTGGSKPGKPVPAVVTDRAKKYTPARTDPARHPFKALRVDPARCGICGHSEEEHAQTVPAPVLAALEQINRNIAAAEAKPAKKTLTREQKDAANARAKAKRDAAREMRAAALAARS